MLSIFNLTPVNVKIKCIVSCKVYSILGAVEIAWKFSLI